MTESAGSCTVRVVIAHGLPLSLHSARCRCGNIIVQVKDNFSHDDAGDKAGAGRQGELDPAAPHELPPIHCGTCGVVVDGDLFVIGGH